MEKKKTNAAGAREKVYFIQPAIGSIRSMQIGKRNNADKYDIAGRHITPACFENPLTPICYTYPQQIIIRRNG